MGFENRTISLDSREADWKKAPGTKQMFRPVSPHELHATNRATRPVEEIPGRIWMRRRVSCP
jgi:hypothetical protein